MYAVKMAALSGEPSTLTVIQSGSVNRSATPAIVQAAKNLPTTSDHVGAGSVIKSSIAPERLSSAQSRIATAGRKTMNIQG